MDVPRLSALSAVVYRRCRPTADVRNRPMQGITSNLTRLLRHAATLRNPALIPLQLGKGLGASAVQALKLMSSFL